MKKALYWLIPSILLLGLVAWRFVGRSAAQGQLNRQAGMGGRTATVQLAPATSRVIVQTLESVGNVESPFKNEISPKTAGRIEYLLAREGDPVSPGKVLLKIDPSDLQGAVLQQQASVAEARSRLAQAQLTQGSTNVGISSQIEQQQAALSSSQANYNQVIQNANAQVAAAEAQVSAAQDAVANAQAGLQKENANFQNAQAKYDRTVSLYKQGFIAAQDLDDSRTALEVEKGSVKVSQSQVSAAQSQLNVQKQNLLIVQRKTSSDAEAAKASVTQSRANVKVASANRAQSPAYQENLAALRSAVQAAVAQLNQAQAKLSDTVVRSTIAGTVTARKADPGGMATPGNPVLEVQFLDWLYVTTSLPVESSALIHPGQTATISLDALPGRAFTGAITNIDPAADPTTRQFSVKVRLDNKGHILRPGMYARVSIVTNRVDAKVVVPREALTTAPDGSTTVVVVGKDKIAHVRPVKLGARDDRGAEVLDGVEPGENVVVLTFNALKEGQKVTVPSANDKGGGGSGSKSRRSRQ